MNALELGLSNNMQIGQVIVNQGFISTDLLDSALRLQQLVDCEQMSSEQAAESLHRVHETGVSVDEAVEQIGLGLTDAGVKELSYQTLLTLARVVSEQDIHEAFELVRQTPEYTAQLLAITGHIQPITAESTVRCHWLINNGYLNQDDALVALDFCLQKQSESEISFDDALEELGWSLGDGPHSEAEAETALSEEESTSLFGDHLSADLLAAPPEEIQSDQIEEKEIRPEESLSEEADSEELELETVSLSEPELELEQGLHEQGLIDQDVLEEGLLEEALTEESLAEPESIDLESSEENEHELTPQSLEEEEGAVLVEEESIVLLEAEQPEQIFDLPEEELTAQSLLDEEETSLESEELVEVPKEEPIAPALQNLFAKRRDIGNETVDRLPAIGEQHGYLSESLSEPFENPDSALTAKGEDSDEVNANGVHHLSESEEEPIAAESESIIATDFSNFEFEPSADLMEVEENFAVLEDSDAIQLLEAIEENQIQFEEETAEEQPAPHAAESSDAHVAGSEDFAPTEAPERGRGLRSLFAQRLNRCQHATGGVRD
jgi:hypothetical protein